MRSDIREGLSEHLIGRHFHREIAARGIRQSSLPHEPRGLRHLRVAFPCMKDCSSLIAPIFFRLIRSRGPLRRAYGFHSSIDELCRLVPGRIRPRGRTRRSPTRRPWRGLSASSMGRPSVMPWTSPARKQSPQPMVFLTFTSRRARPGKRLAAHFTIDPLFPSETATNSTPNLSGNRGPEQVLLFAGRPPFRREWKVRRGWALSGTAASVGAPGKSRARSCR